MTILLDGLIGWLQATTIFSPGIPPSYNQLIQEQATIGWDHFFQGRISTQWVELQQQYYAGFPKVRGRNGPSWSRKILIHIFTHWNKLWDTRNEDLQGKDSSTKSKAIKDQALQELESLYRFQPLVLHQDSNLFHESLDKHKMNLLTQYDSGSTPSSHLFSKAQKKPKQVTTTHANSYNLFRQRLTNRTKHIIRWQRSLYHKVSPPGPVGLHGADLDTTV